MRVRVGVRFGVRFKVRFRFRFRVKVRVRIRVRTSQSKVRLQLLLARIKWQVTHKEPPMLR